MNIHCASPTEGQRTLFLLHFFLYFFFLFDILPDGFFIPSNEKKKITWKKRCVSFLFPRFLPYFLISFHLSWIPKIFFALGDRAHIRHNVYKRPLKIFVLFPDFCNQVSKAHNPNRHTHTHKAKLKTTEKGTNSPSFQPSAGVTHIKKFFFCFPSHNHTHSNFPQLTRFSHANNTQDFFFQCTHFFNWLKFFLLFLLDLKERARAQTQCKMYFLPQPVSK